MADLTHFMARNDLLPSLSITCTYADGTAVDLSTATTPKFYMRSAQDASASVKVDATATVTNGAGGELTYSWSSGDTDTAGVYLAEFEVQIGGRKLTFPNGTQIMKVIVRADIA